MMPGLIGGSGWGGGAFDPATHTLYIKATNQPALIRLIQLPASDTIQAEWSFDRSAALRVVPPDTSTPSAGGSASSDEGRSPRPLPISRPPYGTVVAIDMDTGEHRWEVTLGDTPWLREHPLLRGLDLPLLGVAGAPGPIVTAGGLLFVTGGGATLYAIDAANGATLWEADLGASGYAVPMTYRTGDGRQFVVIATGAGEEAVLRAFVLPADREAPAPAESADLRAARPGSGSRGNHPGADLLRENRPPGTGKIR
jgi:quinoprotein glucose dehydrogenase